MVVSDRPAYLVEAKTIVDFLKKKISAVVGFLFTLLNELGRGIAQNDLFLFFILFAV